VLDLSSRTAVVTGATGNLGHAVVRALLERGAHVAIPVRHLTREQEVRAAVGDLAGTVDEPKLIALRAELDKRTDMDVFVEHVMRTWGRLDIVANL
jgi:3-oxoacyl-[acyl-carrier protein] reductase